MIDIRDHGGSYGAGIAKNIPMDLGKVELVKTVETVWRTQTGATPVMDFNDMKYNKATNEVFILGYNTRKITVVDADTGSIKRSFTLPAASSSYETYDANGIVISDTGRLYIKAWDNFNRGTVTEINPSTGAKIKTVKSTQTAQAGSLYNNYLFEIQDGKVFFAYGSTGVNIEEYDLNLNAIRSTTIGGQQARKNGISLSLSNNRGVSLQEGNSYAVLFDYNPYLNRSYINVSTGTSSCIAGILGDKVVFVDNVDIKFYNLFGVLLKTITQPKISGGEYDDYYIFNGYKNMIKDMGNGIGVVSHSSGYRQIVYIDANKMEISTQKYGEDGYIQGNEAGTDIRNRFDVIDNQRIAIPRYGVYGVYRAYQKII